MAVRWYDYLTGADRSKEDDPENKGTALFSGPVDIASELFVGKQYINKDRKKKYKYAVFSSTYDFWDYMLKQSDENRTFNEVTPALRAQKLRFDIDIDNIYDIELGFKVIGYLVAATILVLLDYNIVLDLEKDVLIFNSNLETKKKTSYHVIIDNYCFANFHVIVYLASKIFEYVPSSLQKYVDKGVVQRDHMLRIYRNVKAGEPLRIKRLTSKWGYRGSLIETFIPYPKSEELDSDYDFYLLEHSLITWTYYCKRVPVLLPLTPRREITVNDKGIEYAISLYEKFDKNNVYSIDENRIEGNKIDLVRNFPAFCSICNREHESIGACIIVDDKGVYFKCWRNMTKSINLGSSSKEYLEEDSDSEVESKNSSSKVEKLSSNSGLILNRLFSLTNNNELKEIIRA